MRTRWVFWMSLAVMIASALTGLTGCSGNGGAGPSPTESSSSTGVAAAAVPTAGSDLVGQANLGPGRAVDGSVELQVPRDHAWSTVAVTTTYQGYFRFKAVSVPPEFRVRVTAPDGTVLLSDRPSFDGAHRQVVVNAVTSLAAIHRDRHPGRSAVDAMRATRRFLAIPAYWDVDNGLDLASSPFGHTAFLEAARQQGGVNAWLSRLADQMDAGVSARARRKTALGARSYFGIGSFTALGMAQGISGGIAGHLFGNILSSIGAGGLAQFLGLAQASYASQLAEITTLLNEIKSELETIQSELSVIEQQLTSGQFSTVVQTLNTAYADIDNRISDPFYQINYTTDKTHVYVMDNQQPYNLSPASLKDDLSTIASNLVGPQGTNDFFTYYVQYFNQLTPTGYTLRSQWDTLVRQWYAQAFLYQVKALNALVEYYHYTAVPGVNPVTGDPYRNNAAARDLLSVGYALRLQEQRMLRLIEFKSASNKPPFLSQDVVRGLSTDGLGQDPLDGTVVSTTAAPDGGLQITWTQTSGSPMRAGMVLDIDQYAVRVRQVLSDEADARGQQVFVGEAPGGSPALPSSFQSGVPIAGPGHGSLLTDGAVYDMANNAIWTGQSFGPFDSLPLAGSYCDPSYCGPSQGGPSNSPWYADVPNLGPAQTDLGDWITTQMPRSRAGQSGYLVPAYQQATVGQLGALSAKGYGGFSNNGSASFYCSDSSLSYQTDSFCASPNSATGLNFNLIDQYANNLFNVGGATAPAFVLQNSNGDGPSQGDPCSYCTEFPVNEVSGYSGTCQPQAGGIPWATVAVYTQALPARSYAIRAYDANGNPATDASGKPFPDNGPFTLEQGTAYRFDLVATLSDGTYPVGRDTLWSVSGTGAFQPDGDFANAVVYVNNLTGMEGCLTILPTATAGSQYTVTAQLGSTSLTSTVTVGASTAYPAPSPTPTGQPPVWNGTDPCASITVFKDTDVVSLKNQTPVNVGVYARFRPTAMDLAAPSSLHTMRASDYGLDLTYTEDAHLTPFLQYVSGTQELPVLKPAGSSVATITYGGTNWVVQPVGIPADALEASKNRMTLIIGFKWTGAAAQSMPQVTSLSQVVVVKEP